MRVGSHFLCYKYWVEREKARESLSNSWFWPQVQWTSSNMGLDCSCEDHMVNTPVIGLTISTTLLLAVCLYLYVRWLVTAFISLESILDGFLRPQCRLLQGTQKTPRSVSLTSRLGQLCRINSFTYLQVRKTKTGNLNHNAAQLQKKGEDVEAQNQRGEDVKKPAPPQPPLLPVRPIAQNYMSHSQMLGKVESGGGPIFKVVLEC